jgi:hypothetical protein
VKELTSFLLVKDPRSSIKLMMSSLLTKSERRGKDFTSLLSVKDFTSLLSVKDFTSLLSVKDPLLSITLQAK